MPDLLIQEVEILLNGSQRYKWPQILTYDSKQTDSLFAVNVIAFEIPRLQRENPSLNEYKHNHHLWLI